jgi:conjugative transfer region protein TrbK
MRGRLLNIPAIGRAAGCVLVAAAIIAAAVQFHRHGAPRSLPTSSAASHPDPLAAAMARCQALGMAAENDAACQATWAENRRRFFNDSPAQEAR